MDAIELLTRQHRELESRLEQVLQDPSPDTVRQRFGEVADHLAAHIASEEQIFYPAVKAARTEDTLLESLEEHLSLKRLMNDLMSMQPQDETFEAKFKVLKEQAEHHHEEEEEHLFPAVRKMIDEDQRGALGRQMMAMQVGLHSEGEPREAVAAQTDRAAPLN
jgi:hemerythrin superfamily protein